MWFFGKTPKESKEKLQTGADGGLAAPFLRLGLTAFGGPAAHIAMMEEEFVRRRAWLTRGEFLDMLGATNLIPGPSSTEMAIHIGHQRAGWKGLVAGGMCFLLPAFLITMAVAWAYVRFGSLPQVQGVMYGVKPVIIAVVLHALWGLGRAAIRNRFLAAVALAATCAALLGANTLVVLIGAGVLAMARRWIAEEGLVVTAIPSAAGSLAVSGVAPAALVQFSLLGLFLFFFKVGAILFGSGYVLLAFLQADLVDRLHWMTQAQLFDAVAIGQLTPGPVSSTATFIGYLLGGTKGAIIATVGIFLPSFFFVAASRPLIPRIRRSKIAGAFLDGVNVGAVALMAAVTWQLSRAALVDLTTAVVAVVSALLLIFFRINSAWLIFAGGAVGLGVTRWLGG